jgi:uncharacterized protein involved in response to NO
MGSDQRSLVLIILLIRTRQDGRVRYDGDDQPRTVAVFVLINVAAIARVCASWHTEFMTIMLFVAGACWIAAFGLFELVYGPMLLTRRSAS